MGIWDLVVVIRTNDIGEHFTFGSYERERGFFDLLLVEDGLKFVIGRLSESPIFLQAFSRRYCGLVLH